MKLNRKNTRRKSKQALVEYIILIVVVALAALFVLANFSDRLRNMVTGVTVTLGGEKDDSADKSSAEILRELDSDGLEYNK